MKMIRRMRDARHRTRNAALERMDMVAFDATRAALGRAVSRSLPSSI